MTPEQWERYEKFHTCILPDKRKVIGRIVGGEFDGSPVWLSKDNQDRYNQYYIGVSDGFYVLTPEEFAKQKCEPYVETRY